MSHEKLALLSKNSVFYHPEEKNFKNIVLKRENTAPLTFYQTTKF